MAAPSIASWTAANATATTVTINAPGGVAVTAGKLILFIVSSDTASTVPTHSPGTGMGSPSQLIDDATADNGSGASTVMSVYALIAGGSEPASYTVNVSISRFTWLQVIVVTPASGSYASVQDALDNVLTGGALAGSDWAKSTTATEPLAPNLTTLGTDRLILYPTTWDEGKTFNSAPAGTSELYKTAVSTNAQRGDYKTQAVAGATGVAQYDISSGTRWITSCLMLKNPSGGDSGALSSAGTGAAAFTGASQAASSLSVAGAGATSLVGRSLAAGAWAASGSGAATFVGSSLFGGALSAAGAGAISLTGSSLAAAGLAASGAGAATWTGAARASAVLQASGTGAAAFTSPPADQGALGAFATSSASFIGASLAVADLAASGAGTGAFVGRAGGWARQSPDPATWIRQEPEAATWARQSPTAAAWTRQ